MRSLIPKLCPACNGRVFDLGTLGVICSCCGGKIVPNPPPPNGRRPGAVDIDTRTQAQIDVACHLDDMRAAGLPVD